MTNDQHPPLAAPTTRRKTLIWIGLAGLAASTAGFGLWALHRPEAKLVTTQCVKDGPMTKRVLIAYATRAGSTGEIAQRISEKLCAQGFSVDVRLVDAVNSLDGYDAVVLGSAIRFSAWLPEVTAFVQRNKAALAKLPVAIFTAHMLALDVTPQSQQSRAGYTAVVRAIVSPRTEAFFAGKIDLKTLSFFERTAVRLVRSPVGDKRDWAKIEGWADELLAVLT
jgi:menaquinone-dependent protoporphyrinogen oxidase